MKKKKVLYLGLKAPADHPDREVVHYPIIRIDPRPIDQADISEAMHHLNQFTHLILTSQSALSLLLFAAEQHGVKDKLLKLPVIAVGKSTAASSLANGFTTFPTPSEESAEGLVALMDSFDLSDAFLLWPHSALSRTILPDYFRHRQIRFFDCILYDTNTNKLESIPDLESFDEIVFTSPSTIHAFKSIFGEFPKGKQLTPIGPITASHLKQ